VTDVHQVVDFRATTDAGFVERAAINRGLAPIYVVVDDKASDLGNCS
jgi:hypothetical protein